MKREWLQTNRAMWDERVPIHVASEFYDVERFVRGGSTLCAFEPDELGEVQGCSLVHPQCHFGLDTLSWARLGARVTGLDFSEPAVRAARDLAARSDLHAEFVHGDVFDAPQLLGGRRFDVVYTGQGAINWLDDIERWAQVMAALLAPGGRFYLSEFHPTSQIFGDHDLTVTYPYFNEGPMEFDEPGTYVDATAPTKRNRSFEWNHPLGDVVSALAGAGLRIVMLHEYDFTVSPGWDVLRRSSDGSYRLPEGVPSLPLMYSLLATSR
jgi:SAM-dependent methyltransferase